MSNPFRTLRDKLPRSWRSESHKSPKSSRTSSSQALVSEADGARQRTSAHFETPVPQTPAVESAQVPASSSSGAPQRTSLLASPSETRPASVAVLPSPPHVYDDTLLSADTLLPSKVQELTADCPQFRILVIGKMGSGKSSLINKVFGVDVANVSHTTVGEADINIGFCPSDNIHLILHDSRGFEPGETKNFVTVKGFIEERSKKPHLKDRLHAIWICISVPSAGDRITERGVEEIFKMIHGRVPLIVVFTKYDKLVTSKILEGNFDSPSEEEVWMFGEAKAKEAFKELCIDPLTKTVGKVPVMEVSTQERYKDKIARLIEVTDREVQQQMLSTAHSNPASLTWAVAQRGSSDLNIGASVDVGRKRYWRGLLASADFTGQKLQSCLDVIHYDIVSVWNINSNYLMGKEFKTKMLMIVNDLIENPSVPTASDNLNVVTVTALGAAASLTPAGIVITAIGTAVLMVKWILDVYENTTHNITCVMGYIVDLTIVMHRLPTTDVSQERIVSVLQEYFQSEERDRVHTDIRTFANDIPALRRGDTDHTLTEIIRLINKYCNDNS